eukprot:COSAG01_NODE_623_length_14742_cov_22.391177_19_plen_398_part_00
MTTQPMARTTTKKILAPPRRACAFFARDGTCAKGDQCRFSHADADIAAFKAAGGAEEFALRRAAKDEEEKAAQAVAKLAKQEAKRLRKAQALASADLPDDSWSYVPTNRGLATEPASLPQPTTDGPTRQPSSSTSCSSLPAPGDGWMSWADAEEEVERAERMVADAKEQSAQDVLASLLSSSEEEEELDDELEPAPKQQDSTAATKPTPARKQLSKKEQKALKKAKEMAELEAALADIAEATGESGLLRSQQLGSGSTMAAQESVASRKKRLKKQRQKAAAAAAKASSSSLATGDNATTGVDSDAASKLNEEEQAALVQKKLQKLQDEKAKKLAAKKRADKQKKKIKGLDYLHKKAAEKHADHVAKKKSKNVVATTGSPPTSPLGTPVKQENPVAVA